MAWLADATLPGYEVAVTLRRCGYSETASRAVAKKWPALSLLVDAAERGPALTCELHRALSLNQHWEADTLTRYLGDHCQFRLWPPPVGLSVFVCVRPTRKDKPAVWNPGSVRRYDADQNLVVLTVKTSAKGKGRSNTCPMGRAEYQAKNSVFSKEEWAADDGGASSTQGSGDEDQEESEAESLGSLTSDGSSDGVCCPFVGDSRCPVVAGGKAKGKAKKKKATGKVPEAKAASCPSGVSCPLASAGPPSS
jgi:hypothetical protein